MTKLLVMTDLHLTPGAKQIVGLDPLERLLQVLDHAATRQADADRLILTGDLTHYGDVESYQKLQEALKNRPWPISLLLGNHDNRANFRTVFPDATIDGHGFVQSSVDHGDVRILMLDSLDEDGAVIEHGGYLCPHRLDWLASQLAAAGDTPSLLFLHHPPINTGFDGMDAIRLLNADAFHKVIADSPVAHIFAGHVHRTITSTLGHIPVTIFKSTCHQMPMLLGSEGSHHSVAEPSGYGIILTQAEQTIVHFEDVLTPA